MLKKLALLVGGFLVLAAPAFATDITDSQTSCLTGSATVVGTATGRISLCVYNGDTANPVYVGKTGATTEYIVPAGQGRCFDAKPGTAEAGYSAEIVLKCRSTGGTVTLYSHEVFR